MGAPINNKNNLKHGMRQKRIYTIWRSMRQRCQNPNNYGYYKYGGRGITVTDEWNKFPAFYEWAMKSGYTDELTLDRVDNSGNYNPSNCRWVSPKEQANNRRSNVYYSLGGVTKTLAEWVDESGLKYGTVQSRLRRGWSIERAIGEKA